MDQTADTEKKTLASYNKSLEFFFFLNMVFNLLLLIVSMIVIYSQMPSIKSQTYVIKDGQRVELTPEELEERAER